MTKPDAPKAREFWIRTIPRGRDSVDNFEYGSIFYSEQKETAHVIEYSAFSEAQEKLRVAIETLENINSVTKKQFEEHPMYWANMANGASGEALAKIKGGSDE